jgi:hypothetical protein
MGFQLRHRKGQHVHIHAGHVGMCWPHLSVCYGSLPLRHSQTSMCVHQTMWECVELTLVNDIIV